MGLLSIRFPAEKLRGLWPDPQCEVFVAWAIPVGHTEWKVWEELGAFVPGQPGVPVGTQKRWAGSRLGSGAGPAGAGEMAIAYYGMVGGEGWSPGPCCGGQAKAGDASSQLAEKHALSYPERGRGGGRAGIEPAFGR